MVDSLDSIQVDVLILPFQITGILRSRSKSGPLKCRVKSSSMIRKSDPKTSFIKQTVTNMTRVERRQ